MHGDSFADQHLSAVRRRSGESYALHGREVAGVLQELTTDESLLSVAILHDLLVLPDGEALLQLSPLSEDQKSLIRAMHPLRRLHIDANTHDLDTVIDAFTTDERLLPLRMAHRLNDVRHLQRFPLTLQKQIARETLHMYTAIAGRLGMHAWRHEMEDICFRLLQPALVKELDARFTASRPKDLVCLQHGTQFLRRILRRNGIRATVDSRIKNLYSTYRKMIVKRRRFEELTDRLALRVVVKTIDDCYRALGVIHGAMHPIPGKLKDYIGAPKENGYRSIHTVVYPLPGVAEQPMEIQIRSEEMHRQCEYGGAHHGEYKNSLYALRTGVARVQLFRNLQSLKEETHSPEQFEKALRTYFDHSHIALFDAKNNLYHLKYPLTALDFVCHAHGKRVKYLKALRVNGRVQRIDTPLKDGDTVEAMFGREAKVKKEWLTACRHTSARRLIRTTRTAY